MSLFEQFLNAHKEALRLDSRETAILAQQLEHMQGRTYDIQYPELKARRFIPVSTETPSGAEFITYAQWDQYGAAKLIANFADDAPRVDVTAKKFSSPVKSLAAAYGYSLQDLRAAAMSGQPLDAKRAAAARRAIEQAIDDVAATGVSSAGLPGFLNNSNCAVLTAGHDWAAASALEILDDLATLVQKPIDDTKEIYVPDTIIMDTTSYGIVSQKFMANNNNMTVLQAFLQVNPWIKTVDRWHKLNLADAAGTGPRIVAYKKDPEVCELHISQDFEQLPPEARNFEYLVNCHARIGGVLMHYPLACAYMDGT